ncbi:hypothetical protein KQQSB11_150233 [Klebsiella quasipneumoniae subsp. quasipneumoniae]|nr:hypothetical protein KQQSB11_150233 [Klebsiella quasipneumoniae subsp. quasipneumoniae]
MTRFLPKMSQICPTRKIQWLEEFDKCLIINGTPTGFNINNQQYDLIELIVFITLHIPPNVPP